MSTETKIGPLLEAAIHYAQQEYPVFPCLANSKEPATPNGFYDATTDEDQIFAWWAANENYNVAIATGQLIVIDIDGRNNPWLRQSEDDLRFLMQLFAAPTVRTPGGGTHHYFRQPDGASFGSSVGKLANGVDVRAVGGYVVAPPSYVIDAKKGYEGRYAWEVQHA